METKLSLSEYLNSTRFLCALTVFGLTSSASGTVGPVLLGAYVANLGLSERDAGLVIAAEAAGYAVAQALFLFVLYRWSVRRSALVGIALVLGANALTIATPLFSLLAAVRFLAGLGMGTVYAVVVNTIAHRRRAQRDYSIFAMANLTYAAALFVLAPPIDSRYGLGGLMAFVLVMGLLGLAATFEFRRDIQSPQARRISMTASAPVSFDSGTIRLAIACLLLYAGHNALWSYQQRMGLAVGLSPSSVGSLLGLSILAGAAGAGLASLTGGRMGFSPPQWIAYALLITSGLLLTQLGSASTFISAAILVKVGWFYGFPLLQGALAVRDKSGRALVLASLLQTVGSTIGPGSAALVVHRGYAYVGYVGILYYLTSLPVAMGVLRRMDRESALACVRGPVEPH
jgi:predicted MFS family arabinose efflux permease